MNVTILNKNKSLSFGLRYRIENLFLDCYENDMMRMSPHVSAQSK